MLCPEVWNFKAPDSSFKSAKGNINQKTNFDTVKKFPFVHIVSVVLPDTLNIPASFSDTLTIDQDYYKVTLPPKEIVSQDFVQNFVKKGSITALSINTSIDLDDCIALTPEGVLILSLNKVTYQELGIEGEVSHYFKKTKSRYIVKINLNSEIFEPGKPNYEKTRLQLSKLQNFDLLISWKPPSENVCPSSVAKYFHDLGYIVKLCSPTYRTHTEYSVKTPQIDLDNFDTNDSHELLEWLGMVALQGDLTSGSLDNFITTYEAPEPNITLGQVKVVHWKGFYTASQIESFLDYLRDYVKQEDKQWIALYVQGFSDSPVSWTGREHHYYVNGDNSYVFVINSSSYLLCTQRCSNKRYK